MRTVSCVGGICAGFRDHKRGLEYCRHNQSYGPLFIDTKLDTNYEESRRRSNSRHVEPQCVQLDFHALRTAFVNLVFEYGQVSPKEAQDLERHSTPDLTFNVYGRSL